nr:dipeptide/oligopeptide/nickel ABC transporter ATP-binding protein [Streptomyces chilikensis]
MNPLLRVRHLTVHHPSRDRRRPPRPVVDRVSFDIAAGETLALIGPSGAGKSTTADAVLMLRRPDGGQVLFEGRDLAALDGSALRATRPALQPVFQDPYGSLSPRLRVRDAIAEPLRVQGRWNPDTGPARVGELLETVGLDPRLGGRRPHELSGGQCQRVGIARALASEPRLLVLDEPVSGLDPSVRAGILNLLTGLQERLKLGYLFICHDLAVVRHFAHRVATLRDGRIVSTLPARELYSTGPHPASAGERAAGRPSPPSWSNPAGPEGGTPRRRIG